jgi:hypothetical protein
MAELLNIVSLNLLVTKEIDQRSNVLAHGKSWTICGNRGINLRLLWARLLTLALLKGRVFFFF